MLTRQSSTVQPENDVITVNAEVSTSALSEEDSAEKSYQHTPQIRNVERPFAKDPDDRQETGSVITMTSDERVQIFVPSPQSTPYNTITKGSTTTMSIGSANLAPLFVPHRMPSSESYRSLTPLNMSAHSPVHQEGASETMVLQETSLDMVKISLVSSNSASTSAATDKTLANDIESLPMDQPVSLSEIQLEGVHE